MRIAITNGRLIDPANKLDATLDLFIDGKTIAAIGRSPAGFKPEKTIDAHGNYILPGLVDICAHLKEPALEQKNSITTETKAAAAAGITTLCQPPNTNPVADTPAEIELIHHLSEHNRYATVLPIGALTRNLEGRQLSEMAALKQAGCVAVANVFPIKNSLVLRRALEYAATHDLTVFLTPYDYHLSANGCAHEGAVATRLGLPGIPAAAETMSVGRDLALIEEVGVKVHFCNLSTARASQMIARAQYDGHDISCDTSAYQLFLTELDLSNYDSNCHVIPPLRTERDKTGLRAGVKNNTIAAVCSNHKPCSADDKAMPFCASKPGMSGLETLLPLMMKLVDDNTLSINEAIARVTCGPASLLNINAGTLSVGSTADICIYNPELEWQLNPDTIISTGHNTPFMGWYFRGKVVKTLHAGQLVYQYS